MSSSTHVMYIRVVHVVYIVIRWRTPTKTGSSRGERQLSADKALNNNNNSLASNQPAWT